MLRCSDPRCAYIRFDGQRCHRRDAGVAGFCAAHIGGTASHADREAIAALFDPPSAELGRDVEEASE